MLKNIHFIRKATLKVVFLTLFVLVVIGFIAYARGYRLSFEDNGISPNGITSTGIISISAFPDASKVYINGDLKGVTDLNITLPPGEYKVEVKKEGFSDWIKNVKIKGEIVTTLDALLYPRNPSLLSLTNLGVVKAVPYRQTEKIILFSQSQDPATDGIYVYDANSRPLSFFAPLKLLILKQYLPASIDFARAEVSFSPNYDQAIFEFPTASGTYSYLFTLNEEITQPFDIANSKDTVLSNWKTQKNKEVTKILETYPKVIRPIALADFSIISFSPDQTKMLYQAKTSMELPLIKDPPIIGANQSLEARNLEKGKFYIYDKKEDKNFLVPFDESAAEVPEETPSPSPIAVFDSAGIPLSPAPVLPIFATKQFPIAWHPDSKHVGIQQENEILMIDYDGENKKTVYAGPFQKDFFAITSEGNLIVLTNLNPQNNLFADLYEIGVK